jgi:hypothetical protein
MVGELSHDPYINPIRINKPVKLTVFLISIHLISVAKITIIYYISCPRRSFYLGLLVVPTNIVGSELRLAGRGRK